MRLHDRRLATIVKRCQELAGYELFQYLDASRRERQTMDSADVNAYLDVRFVSPTPVERHA